MSTRRPRTVEAEKVADAPAPHPLTLRSAATGTSGAIGTRLAQPHTRADAEERYVAARDAWTAAMRAASSGKAADLASLAITQETYETVAAEREKWLSGERLAIPIQPETTQRGVNAAVGQELAWTRKEIRWQGAELPRSTDAEASRPLDVHRAR